ncbi:tetratricopeptide repeat protein [Cecembia rubra]|uniref:tetratricopeptide repeat protein n=1 Tax=Cecembia rubra TaxID=1485585 RepID=UPI0027154EBC|nr:tetratricopeptide repeat protein [Cecembia rubra]
MKIRIQSLFLLVSIFFTNSAFSQQSTLVKDSLSYYEKSFWSQVGKKDIENAKETLYYIQEILGEDLDPKVFDFFSRTIKREKEIPFPEIRAVTYRCLALLEYYRGEVKASKEAFMRAKYYYNRAELLNHVAGMAMNIGVMQEKLGYYDSAINNYREALPIFEKFEDIPSLASVYENIGWAYYRQSLHIPALDNFSKTESLLSSYLDSMEIRWVGFYLNKSKILKELNRQDEGLQDLLKALSIAEHNGNHILIAKINRGLAEVYELRGESGKQYKALMTAKYYFINNQNLLEVADLNYAIANFHSSNGNLDSAVYYAQKSLSFYEINGFREEMGLSYGLLGNVEFKKGNYNSAIQYFQKSLDQIPKESTQIYAGYLFNIGYAFNKLGNINSAMDYLEKSLAMRKEINDLAGITESYQGLAEAYSRKGDYKSAFDFLTLYQIYKDSVFNETKNRQLAELETQYETSKKDQAIAVLEQDKEIQNLLSQKQKAQIYMSVVGLVILFGVSGLFFRQSIIRKKHNQELEFKNREIAKQNSERELLLKEIHHRVKNNLQIISSLLSMQTRSMNDDKMKDAMKESQSRVKTMALIHEKLYQYENLSKINMQEYMKQLSEFLIQTYRSEKQIQIKIAAEDLNLDMDMAVPLGLITNELLSNSLKYAFEDRDFGEITITFSKKEPGTYKLSITDTGKGLDENLDIDNTKSLGLKLVRTLTRQINGKLKIIPHPGASFEIEFAEQNMAA